MFCVDVKDITAQSIHVEVTDRGRGCTYWMTVVYGFNQAADRDSLWGKLRAYASLIKGPWLVCGDFNAIMANDERIGGASITSAEIRPMVNAMFDCNLYDMKGDGTFFTWNNKHESGDKIYSRIDCVFINDSWLDSFPDSCATFLPEGLFDHCPCLINLYVVVDRKKAPFKYFNMWSMAEGFKDVVINSWGMETKGNPMYQLISKLKGVKQGLRKLNTEQFSDIENLTKIAELSLHHFQKELRADPLNDELCTAERLCA
ncbi:uncharacterized protein LOC141617593 [Silene latifolia]|uniref:uncharacterized protein LOC141617593 n=1 Tax=Silene latifolia TaxID=37657 RepID=UPI003D77526C